MRISFPSFPASRLHLPASLGSTGVTPSRRYYGRSDSCPVGSSPLGLELRPCSGRSPCFTHTPFLTLPSPTTPSPLSSLSHATPQLDRSPETFFRVKASPVTRWLADAMRPNRVRHPTDGSFTSCCSPPRLAATQLQSVTGWKAFCLEWTFTTLFVYARRRTSSRFSVLAT